MGYSWFPVVIGTDEKGNAIRHPAYQGTERLSVDGTLWMCHDELLGERGLVKAKTATMPTGTTLASKLAAITAESAKTAICSKDEVQTRNLLETSAWKCVEAKEVSEAIAKG